MKNVRTMSLVVVMAMVSMALVRAGSASATALYNGTTKLGVGSTLDLTLATGTSAKLTDTAGNLLLECVTGTKKLSLTNAGGAGSEVQANLTEAIWGSCTVPTTTDSLGGLSFAQIGTSTEATMRAGSETSLTISTIFFGVCHIGMASKTHLGVLKSASSGKAVFTETATMIKQSGSNFACPETYKFTASWIVTEPANLRVEAS